jgi:trans-aconitate methyltransferase
LYQKHSFVFEYGSSLVDLLDPKPGEVILDVGCGSGQLTAQIADRGAKAMGVDADPNMIERAKTTYPQVEEFFQADVAELEWPRGDASSSASTVLVDAIFSNAALHWVKQADAAVAAMSRALKPGGRFVIEMGGKGNVDRIFQASKQVLGQPDQENPWFFPSVGEYTTLLEKHGIEVLSAHLYDRPTRLEEGEEGMANWLRMFGGILLKDVSPETKEDIIQKIVTKLREENNSLFDGEQWLADYRRLRIVGRKIF